jgi:hypothetical protein
MQLDQFIDLLRKTRICTDQQVNELIDAFENKRREIASDGDGVSQFCRFLVGTSAITT